MGKNSERINDGKSSGAILAVGMTLWIMDQKLEN